MATLIAATPEAIQLNVPPVPKSTLASRIRNCSRIPRPIFSVSDVTVAASSVVSHHGALERVVNRNERPAALRQTQTSMMPAAPAGRLRSGLRADSSEVSRVPKMMSKTVHPVWNTSTATSISRAVTQTRRALPLDRIGSNDDECRHHAGAVTGAGAGVVTSITSPVTFRTGTMSVERHPSTTSGRIKKAEKCAAISKTPFIVQSRFSRKANAKSAADRVSESPQVTDTASKHRLVVRPTLIARRERGRRSSESLIVDESRLAAAHPIHGPSTRDDSFAVAALSESSGGAQSSSIDGHRKSSMTTCSTTSVDSIQHSIHGKSTSSSSSTSTTRRRGRSSAKQKVPPEVDVERLKPVEQHAIVVSGLRTIVDAAQTFVSRNMTSDRKLPDAVRRSVDDDTKTDRFTSNKKPDVSAGPPAAVGLPAIGNIIMTATDLLIANLQPAIDGGCELVTLPSAAAAISVDAIEASLEYPPSPHLRVTIRDVMIVSNPHDETAGIDDIITNPTASSPLKYDSPTSLDAENCSKPEAEISLPTTHDSVEEQTPSSAVNGDTVANCANVGLPFKDNTNDGKPVYAVALQRRILPNSPDVSVLRDTVSTPCWHGQEGRSASAQAHPHEVEVKRLVSSLGTDTSSMNTTSGVSIESFTQRASFVSTAKVVNVRQLIVQTDLKPLSVPDDCCTAKKTSTEATVVSRESTRTSKTPTKKLLTSSRHGARSRLKPTLVQSTAELSGSRLTSLTNGSPTERDGDRRLTSDISSSRNANRQPCVRHAADSASIYTSPSKPFEFYFVTLSGQQLPVIFQFKLIERRQFERRWIRCTKTDAVPESFQPRLVTSYGITGRSHPMRQLGTVMPRTDGDLSPTYDATSEPQRQVVNRQSTGGRNLRHADEIDSPLPVDCVFTITDHITGFKPLCLRRAKHRSVVVINSPNALMPPQPPDFTETFQTCSDDDDDEIGVRCRCRNPSTASVVDQHREAALISDHSLSASVGWWSSSGNVEAILPSAVSLSSRVVADQSLERLYDCIAVSSLRLTLVEVCDENSRLLSRGRSLREPTGETVSTSVQRRLGTSLQPSTLAATNARGPSSSTSFFIGFDRASPIRISLPDPKVKLTKTMLTRKSSTDRSKVDAQRSSIAYRNLIDKKTCLRSMTTALAKLKSNVGAPSDAGESGPVVMERHGETLTMQSQSVYDESDHNDVVFLTMSGRAKPIDFRFFKYESVRIVTENIQRKLAVAERQASTKQSSVQRRKLPVTPANISQRKLISDVAAPDSRIQKRQPKNTHFSEVEPGENHVQPSATVTLLSFPSTSSSSLTENLSPVKIRLAEPLLVATKSSCHQGQYVLTVLAEPRYGDQTAVVATEFDDDDALAASDRQQITESPFRPVQNAVTVPLRPVRLTRTKRLTIRHLGSILPVVSELQTTPLISVISIAFVSTVEESFQLLIRSSLFERLLPSPMALLRQVAIVGTYHATHVDDISRRVLPAPALSGGESEVSRTDRVPIPRSRTVRVERPLRRALLIDDVQLLQVGFVEPISLGVGDPSPEDLPTFPATSRGRTTSEQCRNDETSSKSFDNRLPVTSSSEHRDEGAESGSGITGSPNDVINEHEISEVDASIWSERPDVFECWVNSNSESSVDRPMSSSGLKDSETGLLSTDGDTRGMSKLDSRSGLSHAVVMEAVPIDLHQLAFLKAETKESNDDGLDQCRQTAAAPSMNSTLSDSESLLGILRDTVANLNPSSSDSRESVSSTRRLPFPVVSGPGQQLTSHASHHVVTRSRYQPMPDLAKFIPVRLPVPPLIPTISHNRVDRSEWIRAQSALDRDRSDAEPPPETSEHTLPSRSRSDESLLVAFRGRDTGSGSGNPDDEVDENAVNGIHWSTLSSEVAASGYGKSATDNCRRSSIIEFPDVNDRRFDARVNAEFCRVSIGVGLQPPPTATTMTTVTRRPLDDNSTSMIEDYNETARLWAELYVEFPKSTPASNPTLYHLKVDLACVALKSLLEPCSQVQFSYVRSIRDKVAEAVQSELYQPKFVGFVCTAQFDCLLILSRDAGALVRHANVGLTHSLAAALDLSGSDRILIMTAR